MTTESLDIVEPKTVGSAHVQSTSKRDRMQIYKSLLGDDGPSPSRIRLGLASPAKIRDWSRGEVRKPETINYRTFKPERDGLFCSTIFGPEKDYECQCGKYKTVRYRGITCEKCGVEVTVARERRERMGHIELACPVAHIWFVKSLPSRIGLLLDMMLRDVDRVLYFNDFIVIDEGTKYNRIVTSCGSENTDVRLGQLLSEGQEQELRAKVSVGAETIPADRDFTTEAFVKGKLIDAELQAVAETADDPEIKIGIGAEGLQEMLAEVDIDAEAERLREEMAQAGDSESKRKKISRRLKLLEQFRRTDADPQWMILEVLPVLPPGLRPLVRIDGDRFTSSDLNELYRRIINRNNRLKRLLELKAPAIIVNNEKRMLQEAVDALIDNGRRGKAAIGQNKHQLKSLADIVKGKTGRFRQNLLGKRVDFSGRSVIVVGPELKLHQCGLPKRMALELFKPFVYHLLTQNGHASNFKQAKRMVEDNEPAIWDCLSIAIHQHPVLLNRAPTLHRLGIQAFEPVLIDGKAIQLHPLVCVAFNADFDGDQMAVHVPLSIEAQTEARVLMLSSNNILSSANGEPTILPTQDVVLGLYYLTREAYGRRGEGMIFANAEDAKLAYECRAVDLHAKVKVRLTTRIKGPDGKICETTPQLYDTTVGRAILSAVIPPGIPFERYNRLLAKRDMADLVKDAVRLCDRRDVVIFADNLMRLGFEFSTKAGISISLSDMVVPPEKAALVSAAEAETKRIQSEFARGILSEDERYNKVVDLWDSVGNQVSEKLMSTLSEEIAMTERNGKLEPVLDEAGQPVRQPSFNSIFMMADSGARGSQTQIKQLAGMRGLMARPDGRIIETPITANFREGLNILQYFISTHGARKGLADTALKTSNSGYMTRRLVDVTQHLVVTEQDCGTKDGITLEPVITGGEVEVSLGARSLGRISAEPVKGINSKTGESADLFGSNDEIDERLASLLDEYNVNQIKVRSVVTCENRRGVCARCYGRDLGRGKIVQEGETVGVIAAQSIGEPGTQLTMRTFHFGGAAMRATTEREIRNKLAGKVRYNDVRFVEDRKGQKVVVANQSEIVIADSFGRDRERYRLQYGSVLHVEDGIEIKAGTMLSSQDPLAMPQVSEFEGDVSYKNITDDNIQEQIDEHTGRSSRLLIESPSRKRSGKRTTLPQISLIHKNKEPVMVGKESKVPVCFTLQYGSSLLVRDGDHVKVGDVVAKAPKLIRSSDITGGLPRVAELFEVRKPSQTAVLAKADGIVASRGTSRNKEVWMIKSDDGTEYKHDVPSGLARLVHDGDRVKRGDKLFDGGENPGEILLYLGKEALTRHIVKEVQDVYRLQGVVINDKHIEVIIHQMLQRGEITEAGESELIPGDSVSIARIQDANDRIRANHSGEPENKIKKHLVRYKPLLLGITKASLQTDSVISAASFQETTRVLTEAAMDGSVDNLKGLKENVIVGSLIPSGTGMVKYRVQEREREIKLRRNAETEARLKEEEETFREQEEQEKKDKEDSKIKLRGARVSS